MATTTPFDSTNAYEFWLMDGTVASAGKKAAGTGTSARNLVENGALTAGTGQTLVTSNGTYNGFGASKNLQITNANLASFPTASQSWEAWVNPSALPTTSGLDFVVSKNGSVAGTWLGMNGSGNVQFSGSDGTTTKTLTGAVVLTTSVWHYIVGVYTSATSMAIYVDGSLDISSSSGIPTNFQATTQDMYFGTQSNVSTDGTFSWLGDIDSVKISTVALASGTISTYYAGAVAAIQGSNLLLMGV